MVLGDGLWSIEGLGLVNVQFLFCSPEPATSKGFYRVCPSPPITITLRKKFNARQFPLISVKYITFVYY